jgi:hypothetical protein
MSSNHPSSPGSPGEHEVSFTFEGNRFTGVAGEPLAAAVFRAGGRIFRTMPNTGEARGGYCLVGRCSDCLVVVDGQPNVRACVTPLRAEMNVRIQHGLGAEEWSGFGTEAIR